MAHQHVTRGNHGARNRDDWRPRNGNGGGKSRKLTSNGGGNHRNKYEKHSQAAFKQAELTANGGTLITQRHLEKVSEQTRQRPWWDR